MDCSLSDSNADQVALCFPGNSVCFTITKADMKPAGRWEVEILPEIKQSMWNLNIYMGLFYLSVHPGSPVRGDENTEAVAAAITDAVPNAHFNMDAIIGEEDFRRDTEADVNQAIDVLEKTVTYCSFREWELKPKVWMTYDIIYNNYEFDWDENKIYWNIHGQVLTDKGTQNFEIKIPRRMRQYVLVLDKGRKVMEIKQLLIDAMMLVFCGQVSKLSPEVIQHIKKYLMKLL